MLESLVGRTIGRYEIIALLGRGGMAEVYRARQTGMNREVAIKVLSPTLTRSANFVERFNREVQLIASLEHAHIVPVYEYGTTEDGNTFLTMRLIKGGTLAEKVARVGALSLEEANRILQQVASALDYAHQRGVTHRDIKPSNVLLDEQGNAYLADFGLAIFAEGEIKKNLTRTGTLVGTPTYISPEQAMESKSTPLSDLYSLGVVLYEMLTGRPPFTGDTMYTIMNAHVSEPPPPPSKFRAAMPPGVDDVLLRILAKEPEARYQNGIALARDFALAVHGLLLTPPPTEPTILARRTTTMTSLIMQPRSRLFAAGVLLVILVVFGTLIVPRMTAPLPTPTSSATHTPAASPTAIAFAPDAQRPASGSASDLVLTDQDIENARRQVEGSFIGVIACTLETEYHASLVAAARTRATSLGLAVQVQNADKDTFRQTAIIQQFIAQGAKAIVMCMLDEQSVGPAIASAQNAGIPVMVSGERVFGILSTSFTLTNEQMGRSVGEYAAALINREMNGEANVVILDYVLATTVERADAMEQALHEGAPRAKILGRYRGGLAPDGEASMTQALKDHPDINVIMSINDNGAFGAVKALRAAGKKPDEVAIISVDAETEARRMIAAGEYFRASLDNDPAGLGALMVDGAVKMLAGGIVPRQVLIPGKMITRETLLEMETETPQPTP